MWFLACPQAELTNVFMGQFDEFFRTLDAIGAVNEAEIDFRLGRQLETPIGAKKSSVARGSSSRQMKIGDAVRHRA